jgi:anti-sigma regulatory factor (Ser/Thr protein kinase)
VDRPSKRRTRSLLLAAQHQLRQPLNALSLHIGELRQGAEGRALDVIAEDMRHALQLSNRWLDALCDLEAAERDALELVRQAVPLQPLFASLSEQFAPRFASLGLDLRVAPSRGVVHGDPDQLRRILALLLDNAAKFTPAGKVLLGCRSSGGSLRVEVWDSGPGIAPEQAAQVFEPFFRLENEVRPRERGLGLGLAIARRLAELTGGRLTLAVRPGRGCCFVLTLQSAAGAGAVAGGAAVLPVDPLAGAEVLLLEGPAAGTLRAQLVAWGADVRVVAPDALAAALALQPKLLIADREDFAAAGGGRRAAEAGKTGETVPGETTVVLVSDQQPKQADPPGVHNLVRPVRPARLRALCHYALTRTAGAAPPARS